MIKAVQNNNLCEISTATKSDGLTLSTKTVRTNNEDDDCVYVSPDEAEKGLF